MLRPTAWRQCWLVRSPGATVRGAEGRLVQVSDRGDKRQFPTEDPTTSVGNDSLVMDDRNEFQRRIGVGERQHRYGRHVGTQKRTVLKREDDGKVAGVRTEHWSGRVDATAFAPSPKPLVAE